MSQEILAVGLGIVIGSATSLVGAVFSYIFYMRQDNDRSSGPLGIMITMTVTLFVSGMIVLVVSLFVGQLLYAILTGIGVLIGFILIFGAAIFMWSRGASVA